MPSELKDRIAEALAESGKSKAELARYCQVAPASVTAWCQFSLMATEYYATAAQVRKSSMGRSTSFAMANPFV